MLFFILRTLRRMNCSPKYLPGKYLKDRWNQWNAGRSYGQVPDRSSPNRERLDTAYHGPGEGEGSEMNTNNSGVRRETSVRSTITLPPYSVSPKPEEQIIAREGERSGMDVVVEFPETAEEEEARRDEVMEALYQIRVQRRQENAEREAQRQERRDARARGDFIRLEVLRSQSRNRDRSRSSASASNPHLSASTLLAEHQARGRERRIASVNYAALGRVRHDGTRLRNNSADSDNRPLLQNAAGIHEDGSPMTHYRGDSYSSLISGSSATSDGDTLTPVQSHRQSIHSARSRSNSRPTSIPEEEGDTGSMGDTGDMGAAVIPPPPEYEFLEWGDAPAYSSPIVERFDQSAREDRNANGAREQPSASNESNDNSSRDEGSNQTAQNEQNDDTPQNTTHRSQPPPRLPELTPLPTIHVDVASPIGPLTPTPTTPTQPQPREQAPEHHTTENANENSNSSDAPASAHQNP